MLTIRHFKLLLRKRLQKENGGRRQVLEKELMWEICQEVWNDIPIEDLRPYMTKTEERCKKIKDADGAWVGWGTGTTVRHGLSVYLSALANSVRSAGWLARLLV